MIRQADGCPFWSTWTSSGSASFSLPGHCHRRRPRLLLHRANLRVPDGAREGGASRRHHAHLHAAGGSVLPLHHGVAHLGSGDRGAVHHVSGLDVHRAGPYPKEKRLAIPFVLFSTLGFLAGAAFNHYVAFRFIMTFFASFNSIDLRFMPKLSDVFGLYTKMLLGTGIVFQMPAVVYLPREDADGDGEVPREAVQVRRAADLHRRRCHYSHRRPGYADDLRGADASLYGLSIAVAWIVVPKSDSALSCCSPSRLCLSIEPPLLTAARLTRGPRQRRPAWSSRLRRVGR